MIKKKTITLPNGTQLIALKCCTCSMFFAVEKCVEKVMDALKEDGNFYCPLGHGQHYPTPQKETKTPPPEKKDNILKLVKNTNGEQKKDIPDEAG